MALIHEQLYQSGHVAQVDFAAYLRDLTVRLVQSYRLGQDRLALQVSADAVYFPIAIAIPCGLLLHELLSNCLKHAFPDGRSGSIAVTLRQHPQDIYVLTVHDNGVGLPPSLDVRTTTSLGLQLVHLLAGQLGGRLTFASSEGTTVTLTLGASLAHDSP
jgi:two-component sensor histidine kinase